MSDELRVYVSGPIKNNEDYLADFALAEEWVRGKGHVSVNPCDVELLGEPSYADFMRADLKLLLDCDAIFMLKGWEASTGATCEHGVAIICGMSVMYEE